MLQTALQWSLPGLLGAIGGLASLGFRKPNSPRFTAGLFFSKVITSFFVGIVAGEFITPESSLRNAYIYILGFFSYPVLTIAEKRVKSILDKVMPGEQN